MHQPPATAGAGAGQRVMKMGFGGSADSPQQQLCAVSEPKGSS